VRAQDYWSRLSGYWRLFKDRDAFTLLWDSMHKGCEEYAQLWSDVTHPGILSCPATLSLRWERVSAENDQVVKVLDAENNDRGHTVVSVTALKSLETGASYILDDDYSISGGSITWASDPGEAAYLAHEVSIQSDMIDSYYNNGLFGFDLSPYGAEERKWIVYACFKYLSREYSLGNLENIVAILGGSPFTKFYGKLDSVGSEFNITYALTVTSGYAEYLSERQIENYCFIDESTGDAYEGNYPADGVPLTLCHKSNMEIDGHGHYRIIMRSERVTAPTESIITTEEYGELLPVSFWGSIVERDASEQYDPELVPVTGVAADSGGTKLSVPVGLVSLVADESRMKITYLDNIVITGCTAIDTETLAADDPLSHIFVAGESVVVIDDTEAKAYAGIMSGAYSRAESVYYLQLTQSLNQGDNYTLVVPRVAVGVYTIERDGLDAIVPIELTADNFPITLMQCDETVRSNRELSLNSEVDYGDLSISVPMFHGIETGDIISISETGEQDFYVVSSTDATSADICPSAVRAYTTKAIVYNNKRDLLRNMVSIEPEDGAADAIKDNIAEYMAG